MDKQIWIANVEKYGGAFVVWVDQSTDTLIKAENSGGVCGAMALDFVTSFQMGSIGPWDFLNEIRDTALTPPITNRVPSKYVEIQASLRAMLNLRRQTYKQLKVALIEAKENNKTEIEEKIKNIAAGLYKQKFGPGMDDDVKKFSIDSAVLAPLEIFMEMKDIVKAKGAAYFYLSMKRPGGAHAIAFGFRSDLSGSKEFPGIFNFFDANLGQFTFGTEDKLDDFFDKEVWGKVYKTRGYTDFTLVTFLAKK